MHDQSIYELLPYLGLVGVAFAALHDFSVRTVPNWVSVAVFACGFILRLHEGTLKFGLIAALAFFFLTVLCWRFGLMGGGDVKMLTAAAILLPPLHTPLLLSGTAVCGGVLALIYFFAGWLVKPPHRPRPAGFVARILRCEQRRLSRRGPLPYAVAIAAGCLLATLAP